MKISKVVLPVLAAVAIGGVPTTSFAGASQSAMAGHGWPNHFDTCFGSSFATMTNNCTGTVGSSHLLIIPLIVDPPVTLSLWAHAAGNGSNGMTDCQGIGVNPADGGVSFSQILSTNTSRTAQTLFLGSVSVPGGGTLHYECHLAQGGGQVINVGHE
jgi:hypothetical protein